VININLKKLIKEFLAVGEYCLKTINIAQKAQNSITMEPKKCKE